MSAPSGDRLRNSGPPGAQPRAPSGGLGLLIALIVLVVLGVGVLGGAVVWTMLAAVDRPNAANIKVDPPKGFGFPPPNIEPPSPGPEVGTAAPEIDGEDIDGKPMKLSDYRGKVVLLDFWGNW